MKGVIAAISIGLLIFLAHHGYDWVMVEVLLVPATVILGLTLVIDLLKKVLLKPQRARGISTRALTALIACAVSWAGVEHGYRTQVDALKDRISTAKRGLDDYKSQHGKYPQQLELAASPVRCGEESSETAMYLTKQEGEAFLLTCPTIVFSKLSYDSSTEAWVFWD